MVLGRGPRPKWHTTLAVLLVLSFGLHVPAETDAALLGNYDRELLDQGIRFIPPEGWQKTKSGDVQTMIYFASPDRKAMIGVRLPTVKANSVSFQLSLTMLRLTKRPSSEHQITFSGVPCHVFVFTTQGTRVTMKTRDYQFLKNGILYSIDYNAALEDFDQYLPLFEKALATFEIVE